MIVLVSGKRQHGKSSVGDYLANTYGFTQLSFAAKLKQIARELFDVDVGRVHGALSPEDRQLLIDLGQDMRKLRSTVWADYLVKYSYDDLVFSETVIADWRFLNEYEVMSALPATVVTVRVIRPGFVGEDVAKMDDISETELDKFDFDYYLEAANLEELFSKVDDMMNLLE